MFTVYIIALISITSISIIFLIAFLLTSKQNYYSRNRGITSEGEGMQTYNYNYCRENSPVLNQLYKKVLTDGENILKEDNFKINDIVVEEREDIL